MSPEEEKKQLESRRIIIEMIDAAVGLAEEKGPHPLEPGCSCIACATIRKRLVKGENAPWKHIL